MKSIEKERAALLEQLEHIRRTRPDVYDLLTEVMEEALTLPEDKRADFIKKATPILMKYIH